MTSRLSHNLHVTLTVLLLLSMTIYNSQIVFLRMFFVSYFILVPFLYVLLNKDKINFDFNSLIMLFISLVFALYVLFSLLKNVETASFSISGPMVEVLTPLLILSSFFIYIYLTHQNQVVLRQSVTLYIYLLLGILLIDVLWRYVLNPECFMNYSCRKEAKIIGLFSTTNVIGTFLLYVLFAFKRGHFSLIKKLFVGILFTAMSRAAIVTLFFLIIFKIILRANFLVKLLVIAIFISLIVYVFIFNPLGLMTDGSLISKFVFIDSAIASVETATISEFIFGFGASFETITKVVGVDGYSPHSPFLKAYFYFGFIGLLFYILLNLYFLLLDFRFFCFVILSAFINGIAGAPIYNPTIWVAFTIFLLYKRNIKNYA